MTFPELFALPVTVDLATAARALGISMTTAYRLTQRNAFPCAIMRPIHRYRIPTASLLTALDIDLQPVHPDDIDNGVDFARRFSQTWIAKALVRRLMLRVPDKRCHPPRIPSIRVLTQLATMLTVMPPRATSSHSTGVSVPERVKSRLTAPHQPDARLQQFPRAPDEIRHRASPPSHNRDY